MTSSGMRRVHPVHQGFDQTVTLGRNKTLRSNRWECAFHGGSGGWGGGELRSQCFHTSIHNNTRIRFYYRPVKDAKIGQKKRK